MKKFLATLSVAILLAQSVLAAAPTGIALPDKADTVIVPDGSPLKFSKFDADNQAVFTGRLTLSGTFYYGDNEYNDGATVDLTLYFMPDAATVAHLPYLKTRGKAENIVLTDGAKFAAAVLTKAQAATLSKKGAPFPYATGHASLTVDRFTAGVVCDVSSFSARFVSVGKPVTVTIGRFPGGGC
jgi:hypothetical protein